MSMLSDQKIEEIYHKLCGKDPKMKMDSVTELYKELKPKLYKKLRYKFRDVSDLELQDLIQDSFLKIYTTKSLPKSSRSMIAWVYTITENSALDFFKKSFKKHEVAEVSHVINESTEDFFVEKENTVSLYPDHLNREVEGCVKNGLETFSRDFPEREVVISMALDGTSILEIAYAFGKTESAMKQYIYESKKKLAPYIKNCLEHLTNE